MNTQQYTIQAKETEYRGIKFRSRLEAQWAAFFDLVKIDWRYEPFEIKGWVPDFTIKGADHDTLIEVKPQYMIENGLKEHFFKLISDIPFHFLFLNERPFIKAYNESYIFFGLGNKYYGLDEGCNRTRDEIWDEICVKYVNSGFDIGSPYMLYDGWIENIAERRKCFIQPGEQDVVALLDMWNMAGEMTRFKTYSK